MAVAKRKNNRIHTLVQGRLSYPEFTFAEARMSAMNNTRIANLDPEKAKANYQILLTQENWDKLQKFLLDNLVPEIEARAAVEPKYGLDARTLRRLSQFLEDGDVSREALEDLGMHVPFREPSESTMEMAPECVVALTVKARPGADIKLRARVDDESQLAELVEPPAFPSILPIGDTNLEMYPGALVAAAVEFYSFNASAMVRGIAATAQDCTLFPNANMDSFSSTTAGTAEDDLLALGS